MDAPPAEDDDLWTILLSALDFSLGRLPRPRPTQHDDSYDLYPILSAALDAALKLYGTRKR